MAARSKGMVREVGTALAVLAIYVLTLLLPLHQAAGLQRDLADLGFEPVVAWSLCDPMATDDSGQQDPTAVNCPAAGIAKHEFVTPVPTGGVVASVPAVADASYALPLVVVRAAVAPHFGQARAPPALV